MEGKKDCDDARESTKQDFFSLKEIQHPLIYLVLKCSIIDMDDLVICTMYT